MLGEDCKLTAMDERFLCPSNEGTNQNIYLFLFLILIFLMGWIFLKLGGVMRDDVGRNDNSLWSGQQLAIGMSAGEENFNMDLQPVVEVGGHEYNVDAAQDVVFDQIMMAVDVALGGNLRNDEKNAAQP